MLPGPILIINAPGCERLLRMHTLSSSNSIGATRWSDGKMEGPMMSNEPLLRKSPSEGVIFWIDQIEEVGQWDWFGGEAEPDEWKDLEFVAKLNEEDYFRALATGIAGTTKQLICLRESAN